MRSSLLFFAFISCILNTILHGVQGVNCPKSIANRFDVEKCVGEGGEGTVYFVKDRKDNSEKVVKVFFQHLFKPGDISYFKTLAKKSPRDTHLAVPMEIVTYKDVKGIRDAAVYERMDGDLAKKMDNRFSVFLLQTLANDILTALAHLHSEKLVHQDLKPENILLRNNRFYLADFGLLQKRVEREYDVDVYFGTPCYFPPEYIKEHRIGKAFDIWSLGITLLQLKTKKWICQSNVSMRESVDLALTMISTLNSKDVGKEIMKDINDSEMQQYSQFADLVTRMLCVNPELRITAHQALKHPFFQFY